MIPSYIKFKCNGSFRLIKKLYYKTKVDYIDHVAEVIKRFSIIGLNKTQHYNDNEGFQYYDIISNLEIYFKKLPDL